MLEGWKSARIGTVTAPQVFAARKDTAHLAEFFDEFPLVRPHHQSLGEFRGSVRIPSLMDPSAEQTEFGDNSGVLNFGPIFGMAQNGF